jgi:hypothetical protein
MIKFYKNKMAKLLGRPTLKLEDNIKMDRRETEWEVIDWKHLAQFRNKC